MLFFGMVHTTFYWLHLELCTEGERATFPHQASKLERCIFSQEHCQLLLGGTIISGTCKPIMFNCLADFLARFNELIELNTLTLITPLTNIAKIDIIAMS